MAKARQLTLSAEQAQELREIQRHHPKAYLRERASALLKIAAGQSVRQVALHGLLHPRAEETVADWLNRYTDASDPHHGGVAALAVRAGRGRKPAFSPSLSKRPGR